VVGTAVGNCSACSGLRSFDKHIFGVMDPGTEWVDYVRSSCLLVLSTLPICKCHATDLERLLVQKVHPKSKGVDVGVDVDRS